MVRRSVLFSPGDEPTLMRKAPQTGADVLVFDLEDAVVPSATERAREHVRTALAEIDTDSEVCVRVNPPSEGARADLDAILSENSPDGIVVPKVDSPNDVRTIDDLVAERGRDLPLFALIETAQGVLNAEDIAVTTGTDALVFGAEDLAADLGALGTGEQSAGTALSYPRQQVAIAAAAGDVDAIDTVYTDFEDGAGLHEAAAAATAIGYDGKLAIHPSQVGPINETFTPASDRVEWANRVLDARDGARADGRGVFSVDGEMIDAPLIAQAERIVELAAATSVETAPDRSEDD